MRLPIWLDAKNELHTALAELPTKFPRPDALISPRTEAEMEVWRQLEASRRAKLDDAVRERLSHHRWPSILDATDGWLLSVRIRFATDWLDLGSVGTVFAEHPTTLMMQLLIDGWAECFLEQHLRELEYRKAQYSCGHAGAGGFSE